MAPSSVELAVRLVVLRRIRNKLKKKNRSHYMRSIFLNREFQGESVLAKELREDPYYHFKYFCMTKDNFDEILSCVSTLKSCKTQRLPIPLMDKLALTLRYLASGNSQISMALSYRISPQHISKILKDIMNSICDNMGPIYLPNPTTEIWKASEEGFNRQWNFPNACGAIGGKHVRIQCPKFSGSTFYNYKNFFSIVLLGIVDPSYKFIAVDNGYSGSQSDGGNFSRSPLGHALDSGTTLLPHVILSDDAFSLKPHNMKPYPGKFLPKDERIFNYRLCRGRMVVENAFGILAARWRIFYRSVLAELEFVKLIVKTCVILHNFLLSKKDLNTITTVSDNNGNGNWRQTTASDTGLRNLESKGSNNYSSVSSKIRTDFKEYFNGEGIVKWQDSRILD